MKNGKVRNNVSKIQELTNILMIDYIGFRYQTYINLLAIGR